MPSRPLLVFHSPAGTPVPAIVEAFAAERGMSVAVLDAGRVLEALNRTHPALVIMAGARCERTLELCRSLKTDPFLAVVPVVLLASEDGAGGVLAALGAGFDEVITASMPQHEQQLRLALAVRRAERDVSVHPTTRLPGTAQIERDTAERIRAGELFAVCYADIDHFKEFNDRYGYTEGDRVILLVSMILRDIVKAYAPTGFTGHIGGDDFIFNVPLDRMPVCCEEIIELFDELIPYQYSEEDRRAGYFLGRDRRGNILWVPLMTLSIGVVTNRSRRFTHTARVSELATEMKSFAKKQPGSNYAVDRRNDAADLLVGSPEPPAGTVPPEP